MASSAGVILDRFRLDDTVAVITGAGRGLGAAIAVAYAEAGADVVISARSESELEKVAAEVADRGRRARVVVADLSDPDAAAALAQTAVDAFGRLDTVVNNALAGFSFDGDARAKAHEVGYEAFAGQFSGAVQGGIVRAAAEGGPWARRRGRADTPGRDQVTSRRPEEPHRDRRM